MTDTTLPVFIKSILDIGMAGLLAIGLIGGLRGWYLWKWVHEAIVQQWQHRYEAKVKECDEWKAIALRSLSAGEKQAQVLEKVVSNGGAKHG